MELKHILESVDEGILNEETLGKIQEAFDASVDSKVDEKVGGRLQLEVESALIEMDEDHSLKLERLVRAIDEDHTEKLTQVVEAVENDHLGKLKNVIRKYEKELNESASDHMESITDEIDKYLNSYVEECIPTELVESAAKNTFAAKVLEEAKTVLAVNEAVGTEKVRSAIKDGATQIDTLTEENELLKKRVRGVETKKFLEEKTGNMPLSKANFIKKRLSNKPLGFIKENFSFVENMFEEKEDSSALNVAPKLPNVDRQALEQVDEIVTEGASPLLTNEDANMSVYLEGLKARR